MATGGPAIKHKFTKTALREAETFVNNDIGELVQDLAEGQLYRVIAAGAGAGVMSRLVDGEKGHISIPLNGFVLQSSGAAMAVFSDGASAVPGTDLVDSEALCIRWNNHANPDPVGTSIAMPQDLDETAAVEIHALMSKTGATVGDAVTMLCTAFFMTAAALHDADADAGGTSSALAGDDTAKTVTEMIVSIALADVPASPSNLALTIQPTDGTLGTDDLLLHCAWIEYTKKTLGG